MFSEMEGQSQNEITSIAVRPVKETGLFWTRKSVPTPDPRHAVDKPKTPSLLPYGIHHVAVGTEDKGKGIVTNRAVGS